MPDLQDHRLHVVALRTRLHLYQLHVNMAVPKELQFPAASDEFYSITHTRDEVSIVTSVGTTRTVEELEEQGRVKHEGPWTCLRVNGPMELSMTGIMSRLAAALAAKEIPMFAVSTWNTDFVLVHDEDRFPAIEALREAGWTAEEEVA